MVKMATKRKARSMRAKRSVRRKLFGPRIMSSRRYSSRYRRTGLTKRIKRTVMSMAETKESYRVICENQSLTQNQVLEIDSNPLETYTGTMGDRMPVDQNTTNNGNRIGSAIYAKGLKMRILLEAKQSQPDTTFKLFLVRNKEQPDGGIDKATMFERLKTTTQFPVHLDYVDTNKVDILYCKKFKPKMLPMGTMEAEQAGTDEARTVIPESVTAAEETRTVVTNPRVMAKFYVPLNRNIYYRDRDGTNANNNLPVWSQRYRWVMVSSAGYSQADGNEIGHVSLTQKLLFKDI